MTPALTPLTGEDFRTATAYVQRKLALQPAWLETPDALTAWPDARRDPLTLAQWCAHWLTDAQRQQLQAAVRAARKRRRDQTGHRDPCVNVTLSRRAWLILSDLAQRDGLTLSQWLIQRHDQEWLRM